MFGMSTYIAHELENQNLFVNIISSESLYVLPYKSSVEVHEVSIILSVIYAFVLRSWVG